MGSDRPKAITRMGSDCNERKPVYVPDLEEEEEEEE